MIQKSFDVSINDKGQSPVWRRVKLTRYYNSMNVWQRRTKGFFMEMRVLPVLVWTFTAILIGTAVAYQETGTVNWLLFVLALLIAANAQSFPTHIVNELMDWKSGTDLHGMGGSKVLKYEILSQREMIVLFWCSIVAHIILSTLTAFLVGSWLVLVFYYAGLIVGITYTLPPFSFAYRPFAGEWLGGFAGVFIAVTGAYFTQTLTLTVTSIGAAIGVGLLCVAIMIMFHTIDYEADKNANPQKKTTVVLLGKKSAKSYVLACVFSAIILFAFLELFAMPYLILVVFALAEFWHFAQYNPLNVKSIVRRSKIITYLHISAGIVFATVINLFFAVTVVIPIAGLIDHKKFGKLKRL